MKTIIKKLAGFALVGATLAGCYVATPAPRYRVYRPVVYRPVVVRPVARAVVVVP